MHETQFVQQHHGNWNANGQEQEQEFGQILADVSADFLSSLLPMQYFHEALPRP
jgi:hypothetical protein